jgi:hypothetical protein
MLAIAAGYHPQVPDGMQQPLSEYDIPWTSMATVPQLGSGTIAPASVIGGMGKPASLWSMQDPPP